MKTKNTGLCTTCRHCDSCYSQKNHSKAVLFCEEFEIESTVKAPVKRRVKSERPKTEGLCQNCMNLPECRHSKPTPRVHCNEYRLK